MTEMLNSGLMRCDDGLLRCSWHGGLEDYRDYHDNEWGQPMADDVRLFEKICLEGFQSGLSWLTILRKRESFRLAFDGFDFHKIALYGDDDVERLLANKDIVRHRGKIVSVINNARRALELIDEKGSLAAYFWSFEPMNNERPLVINYETLVANPTTPVSIRMAKDLKKRGWSFVGPTTLYAFMQSMGLVNDHIEGCFCREPLEKIRASFVRPV